MVVVVVVVVANFSVVWAEGRLVEWRHVIWDISWRVWRLDKGFLRKGMFYCVVLRCHD